MRSGLVHLSVSAGTFRDAGVGSLSWSARASSTRYDGAAIPSAYYLGFNATGVYPSHGPWERWYSRPLRCLSTVLGMGGKG